MSTNRLRDLIQNLYDAHRNFSEIFAKSVKTGAKGKEPLAVTASRGKFQAAFDLLFKEKLGPLQTAFLADKILALDKVIDFLEIDIPSFRTGYAKEWYLRRIKFLPMSDPQKTRLKTIALDLCRTSYFRREFRAWMRLMIVLADPAFMDELRDVIGSCDYPMRGKAARMSRCILENRKDLRQLLPN